ncbi:hypothetical protein HBA54_26780 [Pelagibius litoralis]|uniref:Uncharacterized protein n=1 Tax=Pelagibius litoralis TaxID=374515 RepID=A0A967F3K4_9PROT|nr:hypothetical protein [Pelagibius litoralis]NIA72201.1 hypothetical protein [Pelagibius litoralis]
MAIGGLGGGIGRMGAKAAESAVNLVQDLTGAGVYPANDYALAAYLFERIAQAEKETATQDRAYYLSLMASCLETVRKAGMADKPAS